MSERLLREYLALVVEKIRTKKGVKNPMGSHFDLKRFKALGSTDAMRTYASQYLEKLGEGSSRAAFLLSAKYVLKIATNEKGIAQNEAEIDVYTNPKSKPIVAKIWSSDEQNRWLVVDLVKPLKSEDEFQQLAGVSWQDFSSMVQDGIKNDHVADEASPFVKAIISTGRENKLMTGDLTKSLSGDPLEHWGKTPDGRLALLDYGFTKSVRDSHYSSRPKAPAATGPRVHVPVVDTPTNKPARNVPNSQQGTVKTNRHAPRDDDRDEKTARDKPLPKRAPISHTLKAG